MRYRVLYLGGTSRKMTLTVLRKLRALAERGAVIVGPHPEASPSLSDDPEQFRLEADALFGPAGDAAERTVGKGRVFASGSLAMAFATLGLPPDFSCPDTSADFLFLHRRLEDGDVYFVSNRGGAANVEASFRIAGKAPEIWNAVTGTVAPASYSSQGGRTQVRLNLPANGSIFVVFRKPAMAHSRALPPWFETALLNLDGPWTVAFQGGRGAPAGAVFPTLMSWTNSTDEGVKYFSGTGTYTYAFMSTAAMRKAGGRLVLDLGDVRELAEATLNGRRLGTVWTAPFRLDLGKALKPGRNVLRVKVANLWVNRLIGDARLKTKRTSTFTTIPTYRPDAPLRPSGLLGPVSIRRVNSGK
jgi:hypothetical protein